MAAQNAFDNAVVALAERVALIKDDIENGFPDLYGLGEELDAVTTRAAELRDAAYALDNTLSEL
jgi:hypothetical protein